MPFPRSRNPRAPWNGWNKWRFARPRKKLPLKALSRSVARKRQEWVWAYNDIGPFGAQQGSCQVRCLDFGLSYCEEPSAYITIVSNSTLGGSQYQDNITIAKMRGFINMKPVWRSEGACSVNWLAIEAGRNWPIYLRAGLHKQQTTYFNEDSPDPVNPINGYDWTETSKLKEWIHIWQPTGRTAGVSLLEGYPFGVCSDVERSSYIVPAYASGGGPSYNVPAISTPYCVSYSASPIIPDSPSGSVNRPSS